jgi:uncharacterized protein (TIGR03083 family)
VNKAEIVAAVRAERARTLGLLRAIDPELLDTPTALPGWRIREVIAHLITLDRANLNGSGLLVFFGSTERLETWNDRVVGRWASRPASDLQTGLERWGRRFARLISALPASAYRVKVPSQWGREPLSLLISTRPYDEWVHRQDIRRALDMPDEEDGVGFAGRVLIEAIQQAVLPKPNGGGTVALSLRTGEARIERAWDLDTGRTSDRPNDPPALVTAPAPAFVMAAAGRDTFDDLRGRGVLSIEGDEELALRLLAKVRIV